MQRSRAILLLLLVALAAVAGAYAREAGVQALRQAVRPQGGLPGVAKRSNARELGDKLRSIAPPRRKGVAEATGRSSFPMRQPATLRREDVSEAQRQAYLSKRSATLKDMRSLARKGRRTARVAAASHLPAAARRVEAALDLLRELKRDPQAQISHERLAEAAAASNVPFPHKRARALMAASPASRRARAQDDGRNFAGIGVSGSCVRAVNTFFADLTSGDGSAFTCIDSDVGSVFNAANADNITQATEVVSEYCDAGGCGAELSAIARRFFTACRSEFEFLFPNDGGGDDDDDDDDDDVETTVTVEFKALEYTTDFEDGTLYDRGSYLWTMDSQEVNECVAEAFANSSPLVVGPGPGACAEIVGGASVELVSCEGGRGVAHYYLSASGCAGEPTFTYNNTVGCTEPARDGLRATVTACSDYSPFPVRNADAVLYLTFLMRIVSELPCVQADGRYCWPGIFSETQGVFGNLFNSTALGATCETTLPCSGALDTVCNSFDTDFEGTSDSDEDGLDEVLEGICSTTDSFNLFCASNSEGALCIPEIFGHLQDCEQCGCGFEGTPCLETLCADSECLQVLNELGDDDDDDDDDDGFNDECVCDDGDADGSSDGDADGSSDGDEVPLARARARTLVDDEDEGEGGGFSPGLCATNSDGDICFVEVFDALGNLTVDIDSVCPGNPAEVDPDTVCSSECAEALKEIMAATGCCARTFFQLNGPAGERNAEKWLNNKCGLPLGESCRGTFAVEATLVLDNVDWTSYNERSDYYNRQVAKAFGRILFLLDRLVSVKGPKCTDNDCDGDCGVTLDVDVVFYTAEVRDAAAARLNRLIRNGEVPLGRVLPGLGLNGLCDPEAPVVISGSARVNEPPASLSEECLAKTAEIGDSLELCGAQMDAVFESFDGGVDDEQLEEFCGAAGSTNATTCSAQLQGASAELASVCTPAELATIEDLFPGALEGIVASGQLARVPCVADDGEFCLGAFQAAFESDLDFDNVTNAELEAVCNDCVRKVIDAIDQFVDDSFGEQFVFLDVACLTSFTNSSSYCLPEFNMIAAALEETYEFPPDPRDTGSDADADADADEATGDGDADEAAGDGDDIPLSNPRLGRSPRVLEGDGDADASADDGGDDGFLNPDGVAAMCGNRCFFRVLRALLLAADEVDGELALDLIRFQTTSCVQDPDDSELCYGKVLTELSANADGQALIYDNVCPDLGEVNMRSPCPVACADALEGFLGDVGCCGASFLRLNGPEQTRRIARWYTARCEKPASDIVAACPARRVLGSLRFGNVRAEALDDPETLAAFKAACRRSLAEISGEEEENIEIKQVTAAAAAATKSRSMRVQATGGGVEVDYVIETQNDEQADAVAADVQAAVSSGQATFGEVNKALPASAFSDVSDVSAGVTTDSSTETATDDEIDDRFGGDDSAAAAAAPSVVALLLGAALALLF